MYMIFFFCRRRNANLEKCPRSRGISILQNKLRSVFPPDPNLLRLGFVEAFWPLLLLHTRIFVARTQRGPHQSSWGRVAAEFFELLLDFFSLQQRLLLGLLGRFFDRARTEGVAAAWGRAHRFVLLRVRGGRFDFLFGKNHSLLQVILLKKI